MSLLNLSFSPDSPIQRTSRQWHALRLLLCMALASFLSAFAGAAAAAVGPVLTVAKVDARSVTLTWPAVPNAIDYTVYVYLANGVLVNVNYTTGNSITMACLSPSATYKLEAYAKINLGGGSTQLTMMSAAVSATTPADTSTPLANVALYCAPGMSSNKAQAWASSQLNAAAPVSSIINGDRTGYAWGGGGGWNDITSGSWPDWVQVDFDAKKINRIVVYTLQDNFAAPVEPTDTMTFTKYGIQDYQVQYWNGSSWVKLGAVTANNLVKRTFNFTAVTTSKIRVYITKGLSNYSRVVEVEAFAAP